MIFIINMLERNISFIKLAVKIKLFLLSFNRRELGNRFLSMLMVSNADKIAVTMKNLAVWPDKIPQNSNRAIIIKFTWFVCVYLYTS